MKMFQKKSQSILLPFSMMLFFTLLSVINASAQDTYVSDKIKMGLKGPVLNVTMKRFVQDSNGVDSSFHRKTTFSRKGDILLDSINNKVCRSSTFNQAGLIESRESCSGDTIRQTIYEYGNNLRIVKGNTMLYPCAMCPGKVVETIAYTYEPEFSITYYCNDKMVRKTEYSGSLIIQDEYVGDSIIMYSYSEGRIIKKYVFDKEYNSIMSVSYKYEPLCITITEERKGKETTTKWREEYDGYGNWTRLTDITDGNRHIVYRRTIEYFEDSETN